MKHFQYNFDELATAYARLAERLVEMTPSPQNERTIQALGKSHFAPALESEVVTLPTLKGLKKIGQAVANWPEFEQFRLRRHIDECLTRLSDDLHRKELQKQAVSERTRFPIQLPPGASGEQTEQRAHLEWFLDKVGDANFQLLAAKRNERVRVAGIGLYGKWLCRRPYFAFFSDRSTVEIMLGSDAPAEWLKPLTDQALRSFVRVRLLSGSAFEAALEENPTSMKELEPPQADIL